MRAQINIDEYDCGYVHGFRNSTKHGILALRCGRYVHNTIDEYGLRDFHPFPASLHHRCNNRDEYNCGYLHGFRDSAKHGILALHRDGYVHNTINEYIRVDFHRFSGWSAP